MRRLPRGLAPLGHRNYLLYWIGWAVSNAGKWIELTGCLWLVFELTRSPFLVGLVGLWRSLPVVLLLPFAGVVADRVDQRRLLLITQGLSIVASLALGLLIASGQVELWQIYVQIAVQAGLQAFDAAARQALFPRLIPRDELPEAVTLSVTAGRTSKLLGPVIGGVAIALHGEAAPFLLNAATYLVLMGAVVLMRGVTRPTSRSGSFRAELGEGFGHIVRAPVLSGILKLEIVYSVFAMNEAMITIIGREVLGVGPTGLGILLAAPALGSVVGIVFLIARRQPGRQGRFILLSTLGYAGALAVLAAVQELAVILGVLVILGLLDALATVTRHSIMQLAAPGEMRGRIMANMGMISQGMAPLASTQSGLLAGALGVPFALVASSITLGVAAVASARTNADLWHFTRDGVTEPT